MSRTGPSTSTSPSAGPGIDTCSTGYCYCADNMCVQYLYHHPQRHPSLALELVLQFLKFLKINKLNQTLINST